MWIEPIARHTRVLVTKPRRPGAKRPMARRLAMERLEDRMVLSGGVAFTSFGGIESALVPHAALLDSLGNVVVAGWVAWGPRGPGGNIALARYTHDGNGALDPDFGSHGVVTTDILGSSDYLSAAVRYPGVAGQPEKILVAGFAYAKTGAVSQVNSFLARYNFDGSLDATFGGKKPAAPGIVVNDFGRGTNDKLHDVAVVPDGTGNIVACEYDANGSHLVGYLSNGDIDTAFGAGGMVDLPFSSTRLKIQETAGQFKILVIGMVASEAGGAFGVARYNLDGSLDDGGANDATQADYFGNGGMALLDGYKARSASDVVFGAGGMIAVVGTVDSPDPDSSCNDFALVRFSADGETLGITIVDTCGVKEEFCNAATVQSDGSIVAVGNGDFPRRSVMVRYLPDGTRDNTFGSGGIVRTEFPNARATGDSVVVSGDKIILAGEWQSTDGTSRVVALTRYSTIPSNGVPAGTLDNSYGAPGLTITNVTQAEGNSGTSLFAFNVNVLTGPLPRTEDILVQYATASGTALAGSDYVDTSGPLPIAAGQTLGAINVQVKGDTVKEADETFYVNLTGAVGATIVNAQGVGTIKNDDSKRGSTSVSSDGLTDAALVALLAGDGQSPSSPQTPIKPVVADWALLLEWADPLTAIL